MIISFLFLFFVLSVSLFVISLIMKILLNKSKKNYLIQKGRISYSDLYHPEKPLFSKQLFIKGKPDYIIHSKKDGYVPVEVKTGYHLEPKVSHIMQLISYCQLVQESYDQPVSHGFLVYYDTKKQFKIPFNRKYKSMLSDTIYLMIEHLKTGNIHRSHESIDRCVHCSMKIYCHEKLV